MTTPEEFADSVRGLDWRMTSRQLHPQQHVGAHYPGVWDKECPQCQLEKRVLAGEKAVKSGDFPVIFAEGGSMNPLDWTNAMKAAAITLLNSILGALVVFGVPLSEEQVAAVMLVANNVALVFVLLTYKLSPKRIPELPTTGHL